MFKCKACEEKSLHISSLKAQISFLQSLLNPTPRSDFNNIEANAILNGAVSPIIEIDTESRDQAEERRAIEREATSMLTGDY